MYRHKYQYPKVILYKKLTIFSFGSRLFAFFPLVLVSPKSLFVPKRKLELKL